MFHRLRTLFRSSARPDPSPETDRLLYRPIDTPMVLDLLWAEFTRSGNPAAVHRIVSVLDREDRVRSRLQSWLSSTRSERLCP